MFIFGCVSVLTVVFYYFLERFSKIKNIKKCSHAQSTETEKESKKTETQTQSIASFLLNDTFHNLTDGFVIGNLHRTSESSSNSQTPGPPFSPQSAFSRTKFRTKSETSSWCSKGAFRRGPCWFCSSCRVRVLFWAAPSVNWSRLNLTWACPSFRWSVLRSLFSIRFWGTWWTMKTGSVWSSSLANARRFASGLAC